MDPKTLDEARRLFAEPPKPEPEPKPDGPGRMKAREKDQVPTEAMLAKLAKKRGKRFAVMGDDAELYFGKHRGKRVSTLAATREGKDYLRWMLSETFDPELLKVVRRWLAKT